MASWGDPELFKWELPTIEFKWEQLWCSSTEETKLLYLSSLVCYAQVVGGECWSCFWQGGLLSSKKQFAFGKGEKAKVLSGCGVLAVIWVIWMERNRTFKFIVVQRWKSFRRELSSGHIYIGLCFVGNLKITLFLLFCFKWDSSCSLGVFLLDWFGRNWVFQGDQQRNCSRTGTFIFPEMSESCQWAD